MSHLKRGGARIQSPQQTIRQELDQERGKEGFTHERDLDRPSYLLSLQLLPEQAHLDRSTTYVRIIPIATDTSRLILVADPLLDLRKEAQRKRGEDPLFQK